MGPRELKHVTWAAAKSMPQKGALYSPCGTNAKAQIVFRTRCATTNCNISVRL